MPIVVSNQKPAVLDPAHLITCVGNYDPLPALHATLVDPLLQPLNAAMPVNVTDDKGVDITADIPSLFYGCLGDNISPVHEAAVKDLLSQTLVNFNASTFLPVGELFASQAAHRNKLPAPSPTVIYTAQDDIIPAAKGMLAGINDEDLLFTGIAFIYHPNTLGFWFETSAAFDDFKTWLAAQTALMASVLPADTTQLLNDFSKLNLNGLTESLLLRKTDADGNEEHSFARTIVHMLMLWVEQQRRAAAAPGGHLDAGIMAFSVSELFCPRSIVLINAEAHARATPAKIAKEWQMINQGIASPVKIVSNKALSKLTALPRLAAKAAAAAAKNDKSTFGRSAKVTFRAQPPSKIDLIKDISRVLKRMGTVNRSQNIFRTSRTTFSKANRRNPDDFNKPGRINSIQYMPDLHIYIDTSGSISERNYQESVMMLIALAKKMNVNLYFNSFSHVLSQEVLLRVEGKPVKRVWEEFRKIPKVNGGTDYLQIWNYINASPERKRRMSLVITDFQWYPPSTREDHPRNLYYAPCSAMDWNYMVRAAKDFSTSMNHIDATIKQHLLGMIV